MPSLLNMLPLSEIEQFLSKSRVVSKETMSAAPYVIDVEKQRLIAGAGDTVYARGHFSGNKSFGIYRKGQVFVDPDTLEEQAQDDDINAIDDCIHGLVLDCDEED